MATITIRPTSDISSTNCKNSDSTNSNLYSYVDEETLDTGDYLTAIDGSTGYYLIKFGWGDTSLTDITINKINVYWKLERTDRSTSFYVLDGGESIGSLVDTYYTVELLLNPVTSSEWTISEIENLVALFIIEVTNKSTNKLYQAYIVVDYTEGGGTTTKPHYYYSQMQ